MRAHCRAHRDLWLQWVDQDVKTPKLDVLLQRHTGITVPQRTLRRFVAEHLGRGRKPGPTVRVARGEPGEELQVDFTDLARVIDPETGRKRKLQALVFTPRSAGTALSCPVATIPSLSSFSAGDRQYVEVSGLDACTHIRATAVSGSGSATFTSYAFFRPAN